MARNFVILGQGIVIGVLALTILIMSFLYSIVKQDRNEWANFTIESFEECEWECTSCIDRFSDGYDFEGGKWDYDTKHADYKEKL